MSKVKLPPIQNIELEKVKKRQEKIQKRKKVVKKTKIDAPLRDRLGRNPAKYLSTDENEANIYGFTDDPMYGRFYNSNTPQYRVNIVDDDTNTNIDDDIDNEDTNFTADFSNNRGFTNAYTPFDTPFVPNFTDRHFGMNDDNIDMNFNLNDRTFINWEKEEMLRKKRRKAKKSRKTGVDKKTKRKTEKPKKKMKENEPEKITGKKRKKTKDINPKTPKKRKTKEKIRPLLRDIEDNDDEFE